MAAAGRSESPGVALQELLDLLEENPTSFSFFQVIRLLERMVPQDKRLGGFGDPSAEPVHVGANPAIGFPASEIQAYRAGTDGGPGTLAVNFMGLTGPQGVLPHEYTLLVAERLRDRDPTMRDFLDLFHHRMVSLFYLAWKRSRVGIVYEQEGGGRFTDHLLDLNGLGSPGLRQLLPVPDEAMIFYSGLLTPQQRSAVALKQLIEDYFGVPAEIEQFVGAWYNIDVDTQCRLEDDSGLSNRLGQSAIVGDAVWDQQSRIRVMLGPLSRRQYDDFLPTGEGYRQLSALTRYFSRDLIEVEVQLILTRDDVPGCRLGGEGGEAALLGWCTWVCSTPLARDPNETVLLLTH